MLQFWDGFDLDYLVQHAVRKYAIATGGGAAAAGRIFGNSVINGGGAMVRRTQSFGVQSELVIGIGIFVPGNFTASTNGLYFLRGTTEQCSVRFVNTAGSFNLSISRAGTQIAVTSGNYAYNQWHYFEAKITFHTSAGAIEIRHDEVVAVTASSLNTAGSGSNGADVFELNTTSAAASVRFDDFYLLDTTGGGPDNTYLGDVTIEDQLPDADGALIEWTLGSAGSHFQKVDDPANAVPNDSTDVVFSDTNGQREIFGFPSLVQTQGQIYGVMVNNQVAMNAAGSRVLKHKHRHTDATLSDGGNFTVNSTTYGGFYKMWLLNPATGLAWTNADVDGGQFGVEVVS